MYRLRKFLPYDRGLVFKADAGQIPTIRATLFDSGCVVIRGLVPPERLDSYGRMAAETLDTCTRILTDILDVPLEERAQDIAEKRLRKFAINVRMGQVEKKYFAALNNGASIDDVLLGNPDQATFVRSLLGDGWHPGASIVRRVTPDPTVAGAQQPILMHCDGPHLSRHTYSINFWLPTVDVPTDAPGLQLVPGPFEPMREIANHNWQTSTVDMDLVDASQKVYTSGQDGQPRFVPEIRRGDCVVFHNWIMHGSYATPDMTKPRISFELRFNAPTREAFESFAA